MLYSYTLAGEYIFVNRQLHKQWKAPFNDKGPLQGESLA